MKHGQLVLHPELGMGVVDKVLGQLVVVHAVANSNQDPITPPRLMRWPKEKLTILVDDSWVGELEKTRKAYLKVAKELQKKRTKTSKLGKAREKFNRRMAGRRTAEERR